LKAHFAMFARYNAWANRRLYAAAAALPEADLRADLGAFFGSLHRTLNHLLTTDVIWLARLRGQTPPDWPLDYVPHDAFAELRAAREALDDDVIRFVGALGEHELAGPVRYRTITDPAYVEQPMAEALAHVFNHQTHHRGQAHALLTRLTGSAPSLDLIVMQREEAAR
jgi:uncharacterized damage-inducible protein DinB